MGAPAMPRLLCLLRNFGSDERGVFAVIFGLMAIVLVAMGGAVVDYVTLEQTRNRGQLALDAAALALQGEIFKVPINRADIETKAEALLLERIGDARVEASIETVRTDPASGTLFLQAHIKVPTAFVQLVGVPSLEARIVSEATRQMLELEVAMVLDNSGSMGQSRRMEYLKEAATCATNILFYDKVNDACAPLDTRNPAPNVAISIVPFTIMVNVGPQFSNAAWLDWSGQSPLAKLNFDSDDDDSNVFTGLVDRKKLFEQTKVPWRGCVEARQAPNDTTDVAPNSAQTKFLPMFSPDTNRFGGNDYISDLGNLSITSGRCEINQCIRTVRQTDCRSLFGYAYCNGTTTTTYSRQVGNTTTAPSSSCIGTNWTQAEETQSAITNGVMTTVSTFSPLSRRELQERLCKYNGTTVTDSRGSGPNALCPEVAVLPLSHSPAAVLNRIAGMRADGSTNIQQGAMWGVHALSPSEPLTEGLLNTNAAVSKNLIIMTDGSNDPDWLAYDRSDNGTNAYITWGFRKDGRLADTDGIPNNENEYAAFNTEAKMISAMDAKTLATCATAKAADMKVFTIGLSSPNAQATNVLTNCSSGEGYAYFPQTPAELKDVFRRIAAQLAQLRLAR